MGDLVLSRRALVAGVAVSALAGPSTASATVAGAPHADAAVLDLGRRLAAADAHCTAARCAVSDLLDHVVYPEPPAALFYRPGDDEVGVLQPTYFRDGVAWYGAEVDLVVRAKARRARYAPEGHFVGYEPDPEGMARIAEIAAAHRAWRNGCDTACDAAGMPAAYAAQEAADHAVRGLMVELSAAPVRTLAGVLTKARAVERAFGGADEMAEEIREAPASEAETMALAIVLDLLTIAGPIATA